jgi:hypothetical protein
VRSISSLVTRPNTGGEPPPMAGAQRTLLAAGSIALFGVACRIRSVQAPDHYTCPQETYACS